MGATRASAAVHLGELQGLVNIPTYLHPSLGFALAPPAGWRVAGEVPPIFVAPDGDRRDFAANVCITSEAVPEDAAPYEWADAALSGELATLGAARLLDRRRVDAPPGALRTLVHHATHGTPVALEQWWLMSAGRGWVISGSCSPEDYDALADDIEALAESFAPGGGGGAA